LLLEIKIMKKKIAKIALFGRTNVGKSTLFNCLSEKNIALISEEAGTTRDSNESLVEWDGIEFNLIDTAGIIEEKLLTKYLKKEDYDVESQVQKQALGFLKSADIILFLVDARDGLLPDDKELAKRLKKISNKKIILVANKADKPSVRKDIAEFNKLGLGEPVPVSAATGSGTGDLLDIVTSYIKEEGFKVKAPKKEKDKNEYINVSILGKPNVGKSSLLNKLSGEEKQIVSHIAHTTREPNDTFITWKEKNIRLLDTAGMHKQGFKNVKNKKEREALERLSVNKSLATLKNADVALLVIDITKDLTQQESKIAEAIMKNKCSIIIVANKWDAVTDRDTKHYTLEINRRFPYATWAPIQFVSAKTGEKVKKLKDLIIEVEENRHIELNDNALNKFLKQAMKRVSPIKSKGTKKPYIHEFSQTQVTPPKFKVRIGAKDTLDESYVRYLENQLRRKFGFFGAPITIYVEKNKRIHGKHEEKENKS